MTSRSGKRVCVIGAGFNGLAAAKVLHQDGFEVTAFEKEATIGGVWAPSRAYPDLRTNSPRETYAFTDHPYQEPADEYPTADQFRSYLDSYANRFGLRRLIRLSTEVVEVRRAPSQLGAKSGFEVTVRSVKSGALDTLSFDFAAICNGLFSIPQVPEIEGRAEFAGQIFHSSELGNVDAFIGKRIVVIGAGKSAFDCADLTARRGALTTLVFRRPHWVLPRFFFGCIRADKVMTTRLSEAFLKYHRLSRGEAFLHGPLKFLVRLWWLGSSSIVRLHVGLPAMLTPDEPICDGLANLHVGSELYGPLQQGKLVAKRADVLRFVQTGLELGTGERIPADIVILATGWRQGAPFLAPELREVVQSDGRIKLYRFILPPREQRLGFIGYARTSSEFASEIAAHWLSQTFRGEIKLPSVREMEAEIARIERWRSEMPDGNLAYYFVPSMAHYIDELLGDMGVAAKRKRNLFAEYLAPLWPERYAALATERRQAREGALMR